MRTAAIALAFLCRAYCQPPNQTIDEMQDAAALIRLQVMPEAAFSVARMTDVAGQFLRTAAATHKIAVLIAYNSRMLAANEAAGCEDSYRPWRFRYDAFPRVPLAAAEVISFGHDATLRLRTPEGDIRRIVLRGTDPTEFSFEGVRFEILHATGRVRSIFEGCAAGTVEPVLYLRTTTVLDRGLCERVTAWLAAKLGERHVDTNFANDRWFPCDGRFPLLYPFGPVEPPLSEDAFYTLKKFTCLGLCDGKAECGSSTPLRPSKAHGAP